MPEKPTYEELEQRIREFESAESEYKRMFDEQQLREKRYQYLFENMLHEVHVWKVVYDNYGNIKTWELVDANPSALKSWGMTLPEIIGKTTDEIFSGFNATEFFLPIVNKIFKENVPHRWETYFPPTNQFLSMVSIPFDEYFISTGIDVSERKRAEKEQKLSFEMLKRTEAIAQVGSWEWYIQDDRVRWSEELFRIFLRDPSKGAPPFAEHTKLFVAEDMQRLREAVELCITQGTPYELELQAFRTDGDIRHCVARGQAQYDESKRISQLVGSMQDITDRKQAEDALRHSEEKYRKLYEDAAIGIFHSTFEGRFLDVNPALAKMLGYESPQDVLDSIFSIEEQIYVEPQARGAAIAESLAERKTIKVENRYRRKDGSEWNAYLHLRYISDSNGQPTCLEGFVEDITDRKKAESELIRLSKAVNQAAEGVVITDMDGQITFANPAFEKITGYRLDEVIGQSPRILKSGKHEISFYKDLWNTILAGNRWSGRMINKRKDGQLYTAECSISPVKDTEDHIINFVWITQDITEKIEIEERLLQAQKMESIGTLAGGIAHDFNNILSSIIGFAELALDDAPKGTPLEDSLQEVYTAGKRARDLVKQILAFARQSEEERKPIRVDIIAKEGLRLIRSTIPTTIEIQERIDSQSLVFGNPSQIHQLFMNLCTNSAQAMEDGGGVLAVKLSDVELDASSSPPLSELKPGSYMKVSVSDTGPGISPSIIGSIFDPYFTTKGPGEGTGMGLALVHGIVQAYGGKITVDSELGKGTVFSVYLPTTKKRDEHRPYVAEALPSGTERVLFVDDELPIAKMGSQLLERLGYSVTARTSSVEALELFRSKPTDFDLVITDMTMPNMTGDELALELMKIRFNIPVILCTGYSKKISDDSAAEIGIKAFAYKPFVKADLAKTVRKVLDEAKG